MTWAFRSIAAWTAGVGVLAVVQATSAQDLYDTSILRTINITFVQSNWETLLRANYASQTNLLGTLTVDGVTYPNCGIRIRGNTSYTALPSAPNQGYQKFSLNIEMDAVDPNQELMGYGSLNLNNGFHDPTFCREVLYNNYVAQFMPNMRANHVLVTINGANWGVYNNIQQFNKTMLSTHFADTAGLRIKCANNPNGPGLRYVGATSNLYSGAYEIKDAGGFADPWAPHIAVCNAITNGVVANWQTTIDPIMAVDPSIWSVVFENMLTDDDSYVNKGADFMTYRNPTDGRTFLLQTDANETFTASTWAYNRNFTQTTKPFLNRVLSVAELRQRYLAHYRTAKADLNWAYFEPLATALRNQIDAHVQADPKKLYSYASFTTNFTTSVNLGGSPPFGGTVPGIQQFLTERTNSLNAVAELVANGPTISSVTPSNATPDPAEVVTITAAVAPNGSAINKVELWYRPNPTGVYQRTLMTNNGNGTYSVVLPVAAAAGQRVHYYVGAVSSNSFLSQSYLPKHTEWEPMTIAYSFGATGGMRITEWMYSGTTGEFVEFTNMSAAPIDLTGWSMDDDHAVPGAFSLSAFGVIQPGESVVVTEAVEATFRAAWNLPASVKIIGSLGVATGNNLARNDEINLYNAGNVLVDRLTYGDQSFPGTIRTQNTSGQTCTESIGQDDPSLWELSAVGDEYNSFLSTSAEKGSPGSYTAPSCNFCTAATIGTQPVLENACATSTASFFVAAAGTPPFTYQWQIETAPAGSGIFTDLNNGVIGATAAVASNVGTDTLSIALNGDASLSGLSFRATATNACGNATSLGAILHIPAGPRGQMNCDSSVDGLDVAPFVLALTSPVDYETAYPACDLHNGDINCDGEVDANDLDPFVTCVLNGGCQ